MSNIKIECFMKAAETLNFTEAANQLYITQPAFSRNIISLEKELGINLFVRNSKAKSVRLTAGGSAYYEGMMKLKIQYEKLLTQAQTIARGAEGKLVVGVLTGCLMDKSMLTYIKQFRSEYPKIEVILRSCSFHDLLESLYSGEIDISIVLEHEVAENTEIVYEPVYNVESFMAVPNDLDYNSDKVYSIAEMKNETFILTKDTPRFSQLLLSLCNLAGFQPKTIEAPNFETQMLWIENGMGVAGNSKQHMLYSSKNVIFIKIAEFVNQNYAAAWSKRNYNPAIASFTSMHNIIT